MKRISYKIREDPLSGVESVLAGTGKYCRCEELEKENERLKEALKKISEKEPARNDYEGESICASGAKI